jgi:acetyl-CoA synthetase
MSNTGKDVFKIEPAQHIQSGITPEIAQDLSHKINLILNTYSAEHAWNIISKDILSPKLPFQIHQLVFAQCYPHWQDLPESAPAWIPNESDFTKTHLGQFMTEMAIPNIKEFHQWTTASYPEFLRKMIDKLDMVFIEPPETICDLSNGIEAPQWLKGAKLNIIDSCLNAPQDKTAIIYLDSANKIQSMTYAELNRLSNQIANSLILEGLTPGDPIAIDMPMTKEAVAIYLGIIKMGGVVVSIADSFSPEEIATRLRITQAKAIFTQDYILRGDKRLPLYEKIMSANAPTAFVLSCDESITTVLRACDMSWSAFLNENDTFTSYACTPMMTCNILFSSGTTGDPKAIPWSHSTAIKTACDAYLHQDIHESDVLAWPTNLGWMMGPWIIFAALMNHATLAIYSDVPKDRHFGEFIQNANVTMLGVVPTLVATWRQSGCMEGLNWQAIKLFSSTGECSNAEDMLYLMSLAGYKPVIEYCGGTEIGGSYLTSTLIEKNYPSLFTTPAMGLDLFLLDEESKPTNNGEVALVPPSIGLSVALLNANHHEIYYANMPMVNGKILRRHGDQAERLSNGCYSILGRVDDTMNLGGIKVSSIEIERVLSGIPDIIETAAIGIPPTNHGPSQLIIYAATFSDPDKNIIKKMMQDKINQYLNPLFKIHDVIFIKDLPKTASNKIMRRVLRKQYQSYIKDFS